MKHTSRSGWNRDEAGAAGGVVLLTVGAGASLWHHLTHAAGAHPLEFAFLIVMLAALIPVAVLYGLRARWGYAAGILVCMGFFAVLGKAALDDTLLFAVSAYNLLVVLVLAIAVGVIVLSVRIILRCRPRPWRAGLGLLGVAVLAAGVAWVASANAERISMWNARKVMRRLRRELRQDLAALETLEERINLVATRGNLAGASFGIIVDEELVWTGTYGEGISEDTTFNVGSIAKPVVATAVLQLAERGLIDLHENINRYLPCDGVSPG